jgi:hypothetical protein
MIEPVEKWPRGLAPPEAFVRDLKDAIGDHVRSNEQYARQLWCALANIDWTHIATGELVGFSFREAAGLVAEIYGQGTTDMTFYFGSGEPGDVPAWIDEALHRKGWSWSLLLEETT